MSKDPLSGPCLKVLLKAYRSEAWLQAKRVATKVDA